jgi:hypothetical protein
MKAAWAAAAVGVAVGAVAGGGSASAGRVDAGHGLSIVLPAGAYVTHERFTACSDPVERFSVIDGRAIVMLEERLDASLERSPVRSGAFAVSGSPSELECCSIDGRAGWSIPFRDHGRAFYAFLYPSGDSPRPLLRILDSLRVTQKP